jgi:hypothetical protein
MAHVASEWSARLRSEITGAMPLEIGVARAMDRIARVDARIAPFDARSARADARFARVLCRRCALIPSLDIRLVPLMMKVRSACTARRAAEAGEAHASILALHPERFTGVQRYLPLNK